MKKVAVLMSAYNGERYIKEQIDSLIQQKGVELQILVRDDGSKDGTLSILEEYERRYEFFSFYQGENLGPAKSFLDMVDHCDGADYYAFCDQDDIWDEDKLIAAVQMLEGLDENTPNLYFCNQRITDADGKFLRLAHDSNPMQKTKYSCLVENVANGCTMVFNESTAKLLRGRMPQELTMHDGWVYMICSLMGQVCYDPVPHMSYRQHENNVVGAMAEKEVHYTASQVRERVSQKNRQPRYKNALYFYQYYGTLLGEEERKKVNLLVHYKDSFQNRIRLILDKDIRTGNRKLDLIFWALIVKGIA